MDFEREDTELLQVWTFLNFILTMDYKCSVWNINRANAPQKKKKTLLEKIKRKCNVHESLILGKIICNI